LLRPESRCHSQYRQDGRKCRVGFHTGNSSQKIKTELQTAEPLVRAQPAVSNVRFSNQRQATTPTLLTKKSENAGKLAHQRSSDQIAIHNRLQVVNAVSPAGNVGYLYTSKKPGKRAHGTEAFLSVADNYRCFTNLRIFTKPVELRLRFVYSPGKRPPRL
jgi:hypothetical protein